MKRIKLKNISDQFFEQAWELYRDTFPLKMRRSKDLQARVMKNPKYNFDVILNDREFIGFMFWWNFDKYSYIEHFSVSAEHRNKGLGKVVLEDFMLSHDKPIVLEVELPNSEIDKRRIKFYERIGFKLNDHSYQLPSLQDGKAVLPLLLMTYPDLLSKKEVEIFVSKYHPIILGAD